jgi:hypothetical protein
MIGDWRVSNELSGSDHSQILFTLRHISEVKKWVRNLRKTDWEGYRKDLKAMLTKAPTRYYTCGNLDMAAQHLEDSIRNAFEANCPMILKRSTTKIPWWNKELQKLRSEVRKKFNKTKKTGLPQHWEVLKNSQCNYSKALTKAKRKSWRDFCNKIESASEASRLSRILCQDNRPILGCLKRPNGDYTENMEESLKHLLEIHFPGFQETTHLINNPIEQVTGGTYKPREWSLAAKVVSPKGVE